MRKDYIPAALKRLVFDRGKGCCEYCRSQAKVAIDPFVIEHITPISRGGATTSEDTAIAIGLTPIGRATVETLRLNRTGVVNLRQLLIATGQHPPSD